MMRLRCVPAAARAINSREHSTDWHRHVLEASRANAPGFDVILDVVRCLLLSFFCAVFRWPLSHPAVLVLQGLTHIDSVLRIPFMYLHDNHMHHRCAAAITCSEI